VTAEIRDFVGLARVEGNMAMIGGEICNQRLASQLLAAEPRKLTRAEIDGLWRIFVAIGTVWKNTVHDSAGLKSSWLEFLTAKTMIRPRYVSEYVSALGVFAELIKIYGETAAFENLLLDNGEPLDSNGTPLNKPRGNDNIPIKLDTRLAHAKHFVVDEFIRVQIVAGGFKNFIRPHDTEIRPENIVNYNGFIASSRFNRIKPVRPYEEP
jgi:hypothetical protein